jgi:acetyl esterase/lipase
MKKAIALVFGSSLVVSLIAASPAGASDPIAEKILELYPQADTDGDGVLSSAEEAALSRMALTRFPKADADGDGVLSDAEKRTLLRRAAAKARQKPGSGNPSPANVATAGTKRRKAPSFANVKYGEHERHVLDLWLADNAKPTPLAIYIHGGGFKAGSKEKLNPNELSQLLKAGISVAAINYRYVTTAPLPAAHNDAKQALQFIRSKAEQWKIDKDRIAAFGGSAGAQICMWLAFSDDMADPENKNLIERESTRLTCVATKGGQTTNDIEFWRNRIGPLLGDKQELESLSKPLGKESDPEKVRIATWGARTLEEANEIAKRHSALSIISPDDPPIFMSYGMSPSDKLPSDPRRVRGWLIHHVILGVALKDKADSLNVEAHLQYPGAKPKYESLVEFFQDKLLEE